ncbi:molybdenum cofactor biosysynthesis protein [Opitutaceae bacterium EW11]|nr:molybdenum cofactor biosysynthesis protein [Opitutaceae bacterium EW11]
MHLAAIYVYPVKSCRGFPVAERALDNLGFVGDRRFMIVDENGKFVTQRTHARLARVDAVLETEALRLTESDNGSVRVPLDDPNASTRTVQIWKNEGLQAEDCGKEAAQWLKELLGFNAFLVRIGPAFYRPVKPAKALPGDIVAFTDAFPFMGISEASLADLNGRLSSAGEPPVPMDRFRPNLVFGGCEAFAEDSWTHVRIGDVVLRSGGPCARCIVTTTDQHSGARGKEPLVTLSKYRRDSAKPTDVNFGQNFIHEGKSGVLRIGDPVVPMLS